MIFQGRQIDLNYIFSGLPEASTFTRLVRSTGDDSEDRERPVKLWTYSRSQQPLQKITLSVFAQKTCNGK